MIRTMNLVMTVQAVFSDHALIEAGGWYIHSAVSSTWVERCGMALLAKPGCPCDQHFRIIGSMRIVAGRAVFTRRLVLPQEGTALLSVAVVAGFIHRIAFQVAWTVVTMSIVAVCACHQTGV